MATITAGLLSSCSPVIQSREALGQSGPIVSLDEKMKTLLRNRLDHDHFSQLLIAFFEERGGLEFIDDLGNGLYGKVVLVKHPNFGEVALKLVQYCTDKESKKIFGIESDRIGGEGLALFLRKHENLVETLGLLTITPEGKIEMIPDREMLQKSMGHTIIGIFSKYIPSKALFDVLIEKEKRNEKLSINQIRKIGYQIASALHFIHSNNMIHRDVKLQNILIDEQCNARLLDYGFMKYLSQLNGTKFTRCGSPYLAAPEIIFGKPYDKKVDSYSLGSVLFTLASGKSLYNSENLEEFYEKLKLVYNGKAIWKELNLLDEQSLAFQDDDFMDLLDRLLCIDPLSRLSMKEILEHAFIKQELLPNHASISALAAIQV